MHCPFCNRKPSEIKEYREQAKLNEMSVEDYVRMDEGTYHPATDLFCCTECYIKIGLPLNEELHLAFRRYREKVVSFGALRVSRV